MTPLQRASRAVQNTALRRRYEDEARSVLEAALDRDEIADVLIDAESYGDKPNELRMADAIIKHLLNSGRKIPSTLRRLSPTARKTLIAAGIKPSEWTAKYGGDRCGCTDDRCIGHHHEAYEPCECLPVCIRMHRTETEAAA